MTAHGRFERTQNCPNCGKQVTMRPYDIGSGPEMSCPDCEWCWGADGQPLKPLDIVAIRHDIAQAWDGTNP